MASEDEAGEEKLVASSSRGPVPEAIIERIRFLKSKEGGYRTLDQVRAIIIKEYGLDMSINRIGRLAAHGNVERHSIGLLPEEKAWLEERFGGITKGVRSLVVEDMHAQKLPGDERGRKAFEALVMASNTAPGNALSWADCCAIVQKACAIDYRETCQVIGELQRDLYISRTATGQFLVHIKRKTDPMVEFMGRMQYRPAPSGGGG